MQFTVQEIENGHLEAIEQLKSEIESIKESNSNVIKLYEYQNQFFRERVAREIDYLQNQFKNPDLKDDSDSYANLLAELSQRDAVCKSLKDENKELKVQMSKVKVKKSIIVKKSKDSKSPEKGLKVSKISKTNAVDEALTTVYDVKDCQDILKRITLVEAENIKLSSMPFLFHFQYR